jgi:hypothetical protein
VSSDQPGVILVLISEIGLRPDRLSDVQHAVHAPSRSTICALPCTCFTAPLCGPASSPLKIQNTPWRQLPLAPPGKNVLFL